MSNFITSDFEFCSAAQWKQKIQVDLKGADYNETLLTPTNEGIVIKPFYHSDSFEKIEVPKVTGEVQICEHIQIKKEHQANEKALTALSSGAQAIAFSADTVFDINELFKNLLKKKNVFHFRMGFFSISFFEELIAKLKGEKFYLNIDPIGHLAKTGNWFNSMKSDLDELKDLIAKNPATFVLGISADTYQNAGANAVQQVAYALAHANEYLNHFGNENALKIQFNIAIGSNYFFEISKLRSLRHLYSKIASTYDNQGDTTLFASPSKRNKTLYDYNVNMLRTTTECMSALLGGANTIANSSYDEIYKTHSDFGKRIARNQLLILKKESYFKNASDIATNTYYIESITKQMAERALNLFKEIEQSGGFLSQLKSGTIQRKIAENANKEQEQFNKGELVLLGTNKYPNPQDQMKNELEENPFIKSNPQKTLIAPILERRLAEVLEQKRLNDEA